MMDFEATRNIQRLRGELASTRNEAAERIRRLERELQQAQSEAAEARQAAAEARTRLDELGAAASAAKAQAAQHEKTHLRSEAEMQNFRKRLERSHAELAKTNKKTLFGKTLLVLDNLGRAMEYEHTAVSDPAALVAGLRMTYWQLQDLLAAEGVKPIEALGAVFDPRLHEAVDIDTSGSAEPGVVTAELQKGYYYEDDVLRPAKVRVAGAVPRRTSPERRS